MTNTVSSQAEAPNTSRGSDTGREGRGGGVGGETSIADVVVAKVAGMAAREVSGVHSMGGGFARSVGAVRERVPGGGGQCAVSGVKVEVGQKQAAIDLQLVVEYGVPIPDVAREVRESVVSAVEGMTGREVVEVGIAVNDVQLPEDEEEQEPQEERQRVT